ncbi:MAG: permease prefix domain 1-containing protein, partial [Lachnospiraceae bacterium]|nr:permease prefix domain 1-containing protein [Lachnospiraceae bacterium]
MIERYLYDVVRRLPEKQRKDIEEELRTLIEDMLEERQDGKSQEENVKEVLSELGDPAKLAMKYRGEEAHLIGGEYYPLYCQRLKLVLICVGVVVVISAVVHLIVQFPMQSSGTGVVVGGVVDFFLSLASLPEALLGSFGFVTLVFFILERNQVKLQQREPWSLEKLMQIPDKKAVISKGDSIVGIFFGILIMVIFICLPEYIGAWAKNSDGELVA